MQATPLSSGDPIAERRAFYAEALFDAGDVTAACEVMRAALELTPGWAAGWFRLGEWCDAAGDVQGAIDAWDRALLADPEDRMGAALKRDLVRKVPVAETMSAGFVELLFDQYAHRFDRSLVEGLSYRGPEVILTALDAAGFVRALEALDLGCGTGLMGAVLRDRVGRLAGCDLSEGMLAQARSKEIYDRLEKADIAALAPAPEAYDLIVAADVFAYVGALEQVIGWCAAALRPGGWLAFSVEAANEEDGPITLRESRRFAHSRSYLADLLSDAGFTGTAVTPATLRMDRGEPIASFTVTAQRPAATIRRSDDDAAEAFA